MRSNVTQAFLERIRSIPAEVREIVEAVRHVKQDVRQRLDQYTLADSTTGLQLKPDWVELAANTQTIISTLTEDDDFTEGLGKADEIRLTCKVELTKAGQEISRVRVRLDPDFSTDGQNVNEYVVQIFQLGDDSSTVLDGFELVPLHQPVRADANPSAGNIDFDFNDGSRPVVLDLTRSRPVLHIMIHGIQANGAPATNFSWQCDTTKAPSFLSGNVRVSSAFLRDNGDGRWLPAATPGTDPSGAVPTIDLLEGSYSAATITFSSNPIDLGGAVGGLEDYDAANGTLATALTPDGYVSWTELRDNDTGTYDLDVQGNKLRFNGPTGGASKRFVHISGAAVVPAKGVWEKRVTVNRAAQAAGSHSFGFSFYLNTTGDFLGTSGWPAGVHVWLQESGLNDVVYRYLEADDAGDLVAQKTDTNAISLTGSNDIDLGVTVDFPSVKIWTEPAGGGARTIHTSFNIVTDFITLDYLRAGASGESASAGTTGMLWNELQITSAIDDDVELVLETDTPDDSTVVGEWRTSTGPDVWTPFVDGDLVGVDNTPRGGTDLSAFGRLALYVVRAILTPNTDGDRSPRLRKIGARQVGLVDLDRLVKISGGEQGVDPTDMQAEPPTLQLTIQRDGNQDAQDLAARLLSDNHINTLEFRIWWGHPNLARHKWLFWDSVWIQNVIGRPSELEITCHSNLDRLVFKLPPAPSSGAATRDAYVVDNETIEAAWRNIIAEVGVADRYEGAAPPGTDQIKKRIVDSWAKHEMGHISWIGGGTTISSQGRFRHVEMHNRSDGPVEVFRREEIETVDVNLGYDRRRPILFVPWNYDDASNGFIDERRLVDATALDRLGITYANTDDTIDSEAAQYLIDSDHVDAIASRELFAFATGFIRWRYRVGRQCPHLEIGDVVAAQTDSFIARDPYVERALRGRLWGVGRVIRINRQGTMIEQWIPSYADITPVASGVTRGGFRVETAVLPYEAFVLTTGTIDTSNNDLRTTGGTATLRGIVQPPKNAKKLGDVRMRTFADTSVDVSIQLVTSETVDGTKTGKSTLIRTGISDAGTWKDSTDVGPADLTDGGTLISSLAIAADGTAVDARFLWAEFDFLVPI